MTEAPLIAAADLRVDVDGAVALDRISLVSHARSIAIWGDDHAFERALSRHAHIRAGSLHLLGHDVAGGGLFATPGLVGIALCDPPLPPRASVRQYLAMGAKLAGATRGDASLLVDRALKLFSLTGLANSAVATLPLPERRAVVIAQAMLELPALLIAVAPLAGLFGEQAQYVAAVLASACRDRRFIVSVRDLHPASAEYAIAGTADEVIGISSGKIVQQGRLHRGTPEVVGYTLVVRANVDRFREQLATRGLVLAGGPLRFYLEVPSTTTANDVLSLAARVSAPIIEFVPRLATTRTALEM